jgi:outer membrane protein OmpA-like peptidoglycan-associated protein
MKLDCARALGLLALLAGASMGGNASAQTNPPASGGAMLTPADKRISDEAVYSDHQTFNRLRARHEALNAKGQRLSSYGMAKAMCWQDVSFHEYTRNDRSDFPELALQESVRLIDLIEMGKPVPQDTPLLDGAAKVREDLWAKASGLKSDPGYRCVEDKVACAEVRLAHAGHEYVQGGSFRPEGAWRYASPYVRIAENMLDQAEREVVACRPTAPLLAAAGPGVGASAAPAVAPVTIRTNQIEITTVVLFDYNKSDAKHIRPDSRVALDQLLKQLKSGQVKAQAVSVVGHADRLNGTKDSDYNLKLAERRAETVRDLMSASGIAGVQIRSQSRGDKEQIEDCRGKFKSLALERECLLPNRRVVITVATPPQTR